MNDAPNKEELLRQSAKVFEDLLLLCDQIPGHIFFHQPPGGQWSIAQQVQHLTISTKTATAPFALPKLLVLLIGGKANRPGMSYDALVQRYKEKLAAGGKAGGRYVPSPIDPSTGRNRVLNHFAKAAMHYRKALQTGCTENQLDHYLVPHPLLGKITLRELAFFTIYHTGHHLNHIKRLLASALRNDN